MQQVQFSPTILQELKHIFHAEYVAELCTERPSEKDWWWQKFMKHLFNGSGGWYYNCSKSIICETKILDRLAAICCDMIQEVVTYDPYDCYISAWCYYYHLIDEVVAQFNARIAISTSPEYRFLPAWHFYFCLRKDLDVLGGDIQQLECLPMNCIIVPPNTEYTSVPFEGDGQVHILHVCLREFVKI